MDNTMQQEKPKLELMPADAAESKEICDFELMRETKYRGLQRSDFDAEKEFELKIEWWFF